MKNSQTGEKHFFKLFEFMFVFGIQYNAQGDFRWIEKPGVFDAKEKTADSFLREWFKKA